MKLSIKIISMNDYNHKSRIGSLSCW